MATHYLPDRQELFVGGNFTGTVTGDVSGLNNVAVYSLPEQRWYALSAGVDGSVDHISVLSINASASELETAVIVSGPFQQLYSPSVVTAHVLTDGIGVWIPSGSDWLQNVQSTNEPSYQGEISASVQLQDGTRVFAGTIASWISSASGAIGFSINEGMTVLDDLGITMSREKDNPSAASSDSIVAGIFHNGLDLNITILGGSFIALDKDKKPINNVALINITAENRVYGIPNLSYNDSVQCLETIEDEILVGRALTQPSIDQGANALVVHDLVRNVLSDPQPVPLNGTTVSVNTLARQPRSSRIFVGGTFDRAGDLECHTVCMYDTVSSSWSRPGTNLRGSVMFMTWTSANSLVVGGNLTVDDVDTALASYYVPAATWTPFNGLNPFIGTITALGATISQTPSRSSIWSSDATGFWIAGRDEINIAFLQKRDGSSWHNVSIQYTQDSHVLGLQEVPIAKPHGDSNFLSPDTALLLIGNIPIPNLGASLSAVLFNGTFFQPYVITKTASGFPGLFSSMFEEYGGIISFDEPVSAGSVVRIGVAIIVALVAIILVGELENVWFQYRQRQKRDACRPVRRRPVSIKQSHNKLVKQTMR